MMERVEPTITGATPDPKAGTWQSGKVNVYWFMWDGTNFTQNIQTQLVILPALAAPTFTLATGATALTLDFSNVVYDAAAQTSVMQISVAGSGTWVIAPGYTSGDISGTITGLSAITYDVRIYSEATPSNSVSPYSAIETASAAATPTLTAPTITSVTDAGTDNTVLWGAVANADIYDVYVNASDDFGTAAKVVSDTALLTADIAKIAGLRNYYFVVAKANSGFNDSAPSLSDSGYGTSVLFYDTFEGSALDPLKWTETNAAEGVTFSVAANKLTAMADGSTGSSSGLNFLETVLDFDLTTYKIIKFKITCDDSDNSSGFGVGFGGGPVNSAGIFSQAVSAGLGYRYRAVNNSNLIVPITPRSTDLSLGKTLRIILDGTNVTYESWDGSSWAQFDTGVGVISTLLPISISQGNTTPSTPVTTIYEDLFVTSAIFTGENP